MKKKNPESNIQILTSEKDELLLLIKDLNESIQARGIEKNKRKYKKISRRLADLNNTVDNEIGIVSVHSKQRKQLENLQSELLGMNGLLNQYPTDYNQTLKFNNQSQQVYNQQLTDNINIRQNNELNEGQTQIIEVSDNNQKGKTEGNGNTWRTLGLVAAGVGLGALIYSGFKKLFGKDEESEEKDDKEMEDKDNKKNEGKNEESETVDESDEKYDEALIKRYKDMEQSLKKRGGIKFKDSENNVEITSVGLGIHLSTSHLNKTTIPMKWISKYYQLHYLEGLQRFTFSDGTNIVEKISNRKLKEILDEYDDYIRKYG